MYWDETEAVVDAVTTAKDGMSARFEAPPTEKVVWSEVLLMGALFLGFGAVSLLVWVYARRRLESATPSRT
ncbi:MAG: hypothetical protein ACRDOO_03925 [Actinomadura sp.]